MNQSEAKEGYLRVGIVGCGKMSRNHVKAVSLVDGAQVVAAADPGIAHADLPDWFDDQVEFFENAEDMMATANLDVVHIVTPPHTHHSIAMAALEKQIHVYIEKPFVSTLADADDLLSTAQDKGLKVCPGHQLLFTRAARLLRESLGSIGRVVHVESYFSFNTVRRGITPIDQLVDILPHPAYLLDEFLSLSRGDTDSKIEIDAIQATRDGEARALVRSGDITGSLVVSLLGRPVDSYVKVIGSNGTLHADFVRGYLVKSQGPGASVFSVLLIPFVQSFQLFFKILGAIFRLFSDRKKGYPGLPELVKSFYQSIRQQAGEPISPASVRNTVEICEAVEARARKAEAAFEAEAASSLEGMATNLAPLEPANGRVLLTGGTGLFGRPTAALLRDNGWPVTVLSRSLPPASRRVPGVEYVAADLGEPIPEDLLKGVESVIHAAAETAGGRSAQERNSIKATRGLLEAAERSGVKQFIHISSIAVLKPGTRDDEPSDESSPVDLDNLSRGPYVWGKAESENIASEFGKSSEMQVKVVRLGPLVDYEDYHPPGRLGREIHNVYVAMGSSKDRMSVCSVQMAAKVMLTYLRDFRDMPSILNLVEPDSPSRKELLERWKSKRSPLRVIRVPFFVLSILSPILVLMQKVLLKSSNPINVKSAFSSERYDSSLAASVLSKGPAD